MNNRPIEGPSAYGARIASIPIGKPVELEIYSKGRMRRAKLVVSDLNIAPPPMEAPVELTTLAGLSLGMLLPGSPDYGKLRGARVLKVAENSPAAKLGLTANDLITKIDGSSVVAPEDAFAMALSKTGSFRIDVSRGGQPAFVNVTP